MSAEIKAVIARVQTQSRQAALKIFVEQETERILAQRKLERRFYEAVRQGVLNDLMLKAVVLLDSDKLEVLYRKD